MKNDKKINELKTKVQALKESKKQADKELAEKKELLNLNKSTVGSKKAGNGWLIVAALLVVAEFALLFEGTFHFRFLDLIIIGIPLVIGINKKKSSLKNINTMVELLLDY